MGLRSLARALAGLALALLATATPAQEKPPAEPTVTAIPVPEIAGRAEEVTALLRSLDRLLLPSPEIEAIERQLSASDERLRLRAERTTQALQGAPPLMVLDDLAEEWQAVRLALVGSNERLTRRASQLEQELTRLTGLRGVWVRSREAAGASKAPQPVTERIDAILGAIADARVKLEAQRTSTLGIQARAARELALCEETLAQVGQARSRAVGQLRARDSLPIWSPELRGRAWSELPSRIRESARVERMLLGGFSAAHRHKLPLHLVIFLGFAWLLYSLRARARRWVEEDPGVEAAALVVARPISSALVLSLLIAPYLYPQEPRVLRDLVGALMLVPVLRIMRPLLDPPVVPGLYALGGFFLIDRLRNLAAALPLLEQVLFLLEMLIGVVILAWLLATTRPDARDAGPGSGGRRTLVRGGARVVLVVLVTAFLAGAVGYMGLAQLLGVGVLGSSYVALVLYVSVRVLEGLAACALRVRPLVWLNLVRRHRSLLQRRATTVLSWLAVGTWSLVTLDQFALLDPAVAMVRTALAADLIPGHITVTLGDLVEFALTVCSAFLLSALVRFVLEEDVYPRGRLTRGLPNTVSSLLHYAILFVGFSLAVVALGFDLNRVTILAGAFGVGIGFGLQNVVNNFVSGLILLVERPINVGDAVQLGDVSGEVRRIGIRASTLRTWEGAEVIVPNGTLVSERLTNWTLSDRMRRIDLAVLVAYGSDPAQVLEVLLHVARSHPLVVREPEPIALFIRFGDYALHFELRVWTDQFDQWLQVRSDLGIALHAALTAAKIEIPVPQQEIRMRPAPPGA